MSEPEKLFCPNCKEWYPQTNFECLPLDLRCNRCIPQDVAMKLYDERVQQAGQKMAQILDSTEKVKNLKPLERMVKNTYEHWGGEHAFCEDVVTWIKDLGGNPRTKSAAVQAAMKLLHLHAKVDRMKLEDDWKQMDDETLRANLKLKMLALLAEASEEEGKKGVYKKLLGDDVAGNQ